MKINEALNGKVVKNAKNVLASMGYYTILPQKLFALSQKKTINPTQFLILSYFVSKVSALDHNELKFTHNDISKSLGIHRNTVASCLLKLEHLGFILVFKSSGLQGQPNTYVLDLDVLCDRIGGNSVSQKKCAKESKVLHKNCAKGYAQEFDTSYYSNNFVIKNLSKAFSNKVCEVLEKIALESKIERDTLLKFVDEKNLDYFNAIQNKINPYTYIKNGFENWNLTFHENEKIRIDDEIKRKQNEDMVHRSLYFSALRQLQSFNYDNEEIISQLNNQGFDGLEYGL